MVLLAAAPLALADTHFVNRGDQGPRASSVTWEYTPTTLGMWVGHIVNDGLRSLVVEVYDNTTGAMELISHQRIRFAALGAYPTGAVDTEGVIVSPSHRYTITVIPNGPKGSSCTVSDPIQGPPPVAEFWVIVDHKTVYVDATDSYDIDGTIVAYDWTFGDGGTAYGPTATHSYATTGAFLVVLTVTDNDGLTGWKREIVQSGGPPVATFLVTVDDKTVYVDATSSYDSDGWIVGTLFEWGDGSMSSPAVTQHSYAAPGNYTITLTVWDNDGLSNQTSRTVYIIDLPPIVSFICIKSGLTVEGRAYGSDDYGIVNYTWDWGDGSPPEVAWTYIVRHTYGAGLGGILHFNITVTVTDTIGQTGTASKYLALAPLPVASFTYTVSGSTVYVDASSSSAEAGIVSYTWNWGDGTTGSGMTASHTYGSSATAPAISSSTTGRQLWWMFGCVYLPDGVTPAVGATVTVTNLRSGYSETLISDEQGYYGTGLIEDPGGPPDSGGPWQGDVLNVTAVKDTLIGWNEGVVDYGQGYLWLDVLLGGSHWITLTVTDTLGQTSTVRQTVVEV